MKTATITFRGITPYGQSKAMHSKRKDKESADDYEERCWREKIHTNIDDQVVIPAMAFAKMLKGCAKFLSEQIPGKGKATYTKHFKAGVMVTDDIAILKNPAKGSGTYTREGTEHLRLFVPNPGSGGRVWKHFPTYNQWGGVARVLVLDDTITESVLEKYATEAGKFIGLGYWRPDPYKVGKLTSSGNWGRFEVLGVSWS